MTHPLRDAKKPSSDRQRRIKTGESFDPEELTRRLQAHLISQKIKSEKRREARALKAAAQNSYHHVPATAALSFERTTTQAKPMGKMVLMGKGGRGSGELERERDRGVVTLLQKNVAMDQAMLDAHLLRNRNQFQWTTEMEEAAEVDEERDIYKVPQRTFNGEFGHLIGSSHQHHQQHKKNVPRPLSTGDLFWEENDEGASPPPTTKQKKVVMKPQHEIVNEHRNDWAQRDDEVERRKKEKKDGSPFLRKMESSWMLMGKKEKKDEGIAGFGSSPPDGKGAKGSFLARFKRHPS